MTEKLKKGMISELLFRSFLNIGFYLVVVTYLHLLYLQVEYGMSIWFLSINSRFQSHTIRQLQHILVFLHISITTSETT